MVGGHRLVAKGVGERASNRRFVSWLLAEIQPPKEMAGMSIMVEMSLIKNEGMCDCMR
jgi:hypothetical protein